MDSIDYWLVCWQMTMLEGSVAVRGRLAYVAQQAWILNATLRDNILFGQEYQEDRWEGDTWGTGVDILELLWLTDSWLCFCLSLQVSDRAECLLSQTRPRPAAQCWPYRGDITSCLYFSMACALYVEVEVWAYRRYCLWTGWWYMFLTLLERRSSGCLGNLMPVVQPQIEEEQPCWRSHGTCGLEEGLWLPGSIL